MKYSEAIMWVKTLNSPDPDADVEQKAEAIHTIMSMETINAVTKADLLQIVKWLWNMIFEWEDQE